MLKFFIEVKEHEFVLQQWDEIEDLLKNSFGESEFSQEFSMDFVLDDTFNGVPKPLDGSPRPSRDGLKDIIAFSSNQEVIGAIFSVPTCRKENEIGGSCGWFFTSSNLARIERIRLADALFREFHQVMIQAGFKYVIAEIGTQEGAKYLQKRFGYTHSPTSNTNNRWILKLSAAG